MGTSRLESFSDGVIAVAITLLVLNLVPPTFDSRHPHSLIWLLGRNWPQYAAYATSFLTIGIIWINHHAAISRLASADHSILVLNLLLLLSIGVLPFATALMAKYLTAAQGESTAAAIYAGSFELMSLLFFALARQILIRRPHLLAVPLPAAQRRLILRRSGIGLIPYLVATAMAFVSPYVTIAICLGLAAFYAHPAASGRDLPASDAPAAR
jgi:uncharacterized membrane protein